MSPAFGIEFGKAFLSKFKYRDRATIIGSILESINRDSQGQTKTSIMRSSNLNFGQANKYLDFLQACDLVKATDPLRNQEMARYKLTGKGATLLRDFEVWRLVLETFRQKVL